jgi:hypothetical protein
MTTAEQGLTSVAFTTMDVADEPDLAAKSLYLHQQIEHYLKKHGKATVRAITEALEPSRPGLTEDHVRRELNRVASKFVRFENSSEWALRHQES